MRYFAAGIVILGLLSLAACQSGPVSVSDKVLADFGLRERPEGYVTGSDKVFEQLEIVGAAEMKRMNAAQRHGAIKFEESGRRSQYYKEVKVYESFRAMDADGTTGGGTRDRGYTGIIEYSYRIMQGERKPTRTEAEALSATIPTGEEGKEAYRYNFSSGGVWDGAAGEKTRR